MDDRDALKIAAIVVTTLFITYNVGYLVYLYKHGYAMPAWLRRDWFMFKLCMHRWYRKWYGGRWEEWFVGDFFTPMWFHVKPYKHWPKHTPALGVHGSPTVEVYKERP